MTSPAAQSNSSTATRSVRPAPVSEVELSCRLPLLVLFISAAKWLVIAWVFELIASIKFHSPSFLADYAWLACNGRVHPAFTNSLIYGFCVQAGLGFSIWFLAHLGATSLVHRWLVTLGAAFWNLGVTVGVIGILLGDSTGFENFEMPGYAGVLCFIGYLGIGLWAVVTFHQSRDRKLFASHWFLLTALFWFPWVFSTASLLLLNFPVRGVAQAVIAWWYSDNLLVVWLALVGLGAVFYFIPKFTGRALHSHYLAIFAYWVLILFAGWGGIPGSAPLPAWMSALSTVTTVLSLLALIAVAINVCQTSGCSARIALGHPLLRFVTFGVFAFLIGGFLRAAIPLVETTQTLHLTWFGPALTQLNVYGFYVMIMFAAVYFIMPRLMGVELPWPKLVRAHFWFAAAGILLLVIPYLISGLVEQFKVQNVSQPFIDVVLSTLPFLRVSTMGDLLLLIGHLLFLTNMAGLVVRFYRARAQAAYAELTADLFKTAGAGS